LISKNTEDKSRVKADQTCEINLWRNKIEEEMFDPVTKKNIIYMMRGNQEATIMAFKCIKRMEHALAKNLKSINSCKWNKYASSDDESIKA
jgi:hypothetical protein